jgi:hypothetical protein
MDTHINPDPSSHRSEPVFTAALPQELREASAAEEGVPPDAAVVAGEPPPPTSGPPRPGRGCRTVLLAAAVVVGVGGAVFLVSPYNGVYPVPQLASAVRNLAGEAFPAKPAVLAPSASLASVSAPLPPPERREKYKPQASATALHEVLGFRGSNPASAISSPAAEGHPDPARNGGPPPGYVPTEPGMVASAVPPKASPAASTVAPNALPATTTADRQPPAPTGHRDLTGSVVARMEASRESGPSTPTIATAAEPEPVPSVTKSVAPASLPPPAAAPAPAAVAAQKGAPSPGSPWKAAATPPSDPVATALALRGAPMSPPEEVDVLQVVTRLAALIRDQKLAIAELRTDVAKAGADGSARIEDFQRRLTLVEARKALVGAEDASAEARSPAEPAAAATPPAAIVRPVLAVARTPSGAAADSDPPKYRVQAASPGLAMLAEVDRGGGDGAQVQVTVGDDLPGYGKVKSVSQRGTNWVVATEKGVIGK